MSMFRKFINRLAGFGSDTKGAATVEFVILAPILFTTVFSVFESGWLMTKYMMLDRGLDLAVREVRLGLDPTASETSIKAKVCEYALILRDCETSLMIEMTPIATVADIPTTATTCADRTGGTTPLASFATGARSQIMYVRACAVVDPIFPGMGIGLQLPKDASGGFALLATSVFVNEPE